MDIKYRLCHPRATQPGVQIYGRLKEQIIEKASVRNRHERMKMEWDKETHQNMRGEVDSTRSMKRGGLMGPYAL